MHSTLRWPRWKWSIIVPAVMITFSLPATTVSAQPKNVVERPLPLDPAVRTGRLANGFTYFIRRNTEPKSRVVLYLVNKAGSILESDDQRGLAHFMEHMSFNGTTHFPKNELVDYLQKSGVRFGADLNAYTSFDETVYQLPLPSDDRDLLQHGFQIMRDWAQEATLDPTEIDKERGVVLEEKRLGKGAQERMQQKYWPLLLNHSRYSVRMPIGTDSVLNNFKPATIRKFYHDWYRPNLQALIVVGDINVDSVEQLVKKKFADLKNPVGERPRTKYEIGLTGKNQFIAVTDVEMPQTVAEVLIKQKGTGLSTASDYRKAMVRQLFNQMLQQRYIELGQQANSPFVQAGAGIQDFMGGLSLFDVNVAAKPGLLESAFKASWREAIRAGRYGFAQSELDRAAQSYMSSMESALKEKDKTNSQSYVGEYQRYFLKGEAAPGIDKEYALVKQYLPGITLAEVNALGKEYIKTTDRDILILAPEKEKAGLPDEATVNGWLKAVEEEKMTAYQDDMKGEQLLPVKPAPGKVVDVKQNKALGITEMTLSNGVRVIVKPTDFKNNEIYFTGFAPGGSSLYDDADFQSAANAAGIISNGGAGDFNLVQLGKYLAGKQLSVQPYIGDRMQGVNGGAVNKDLETVLQLTYLYFTAPRKDTSIFHNIISRSKASLANRASDPNSVFSDTVSAVLGNYNVRSGGPTLAKLEQIDLDKAFAIYKERFSDASGFTFIFVGSIDTSVLRPMLEQYLGALPATHLNVQPKDRGIHIPAGMISKNVYKGKEPKATVRLVLSGDYTFSNENNDLLQAISEVLEIRLLERLREEEGGVYSPNASVNFTKYPTSRYALTIAFGCAPQNVDKLVASALDELDKLRKSGPLPVNLEKYKAETLRSFETQNKTNGFWLNYLASQYQNNEDAGQVLHQKEDLDKITVQAVQQAASLYFKGNNLIRLVLLPE
ncbi:MAG: insulinase family protein [Chitinophagaceae bacterium]|nr:insulinase family protein [Chitinophagaceae bacterium]